MEISTRVDRLEEALAQLAAAEARANDRLEELAAAQRQTEAQFGALAAAQSRTEARLQELAASQKELAAAQSRTEARLEELAAAQGRTEVRLGELAAAQSRTEARLEELATAQKELAAAQSRTETQLGTLIAWQQGERGRREGEALERNTVRRARTLFFGGAGGAPDQEPARGLLDEALLRVMKPDSVLPPEGDPSLSDLLWRKGDRLAVVEISRVVDDHDVDRAVRRAQTLQQAGLDAFPMVIGGAWADDIALGHAETMRLAWHVGNSVSEPYIAFRRLPPHPPV